MSAYRLLLEDYLTNFRNMEFEMYSALRGVKWLKDKDTTH